MREDSRDFGSQLNSARPRELLEIKEVINNMQCISTMNHQSANCHSMCHKKTYSCIPQRGSENWSKAEWSHLLCYLALIILQGEENIYPLGSSLWKYTFKPSCNKVQFIVNILDRWENDFCCGPATGKHTSWFVYFLTFWGIFHLFLIPSSLPLVLISHIQMSWILDWPGKATAYPYCPYFLSKPSSSPTTFPQKSL